ncbi:MAG TPA: ABC transporter permease [Hyphomicrobium sp.]|nr:ABC transporter permease [Hyphomicrobium sp.]
MQQILWLEVILKSAAGLALLLIPLTAIRLTGMQRPEQGFWPRLLGAVLLGIAAAIYISLQFPDARGGLGPAGLIPINLGGAAGLIAPLIMGTAAPTRRGKLFVFVNAIALLTLAFLEIAHI